MSLFFIKSLMAIVFLFTGLIAVLTMFILMGRTNLKIDANFLRKMHKASGFIFFILLLVISYFCIKYWVMARDNLSVRAIFHGFLAFFLLAVLILKILIVQYYKQLIRFVPAMGMTIFCLAFVVTGTSAGYYLLRMSAAKTESVKVAALPQTPFQGNKEIGAAIFADKCSSCHYPDREETKQGPGLKNLLKKEKLPRS